jgi:hypothetical protein
MGIMSAMTFTEKMNALPDRLASLVVAASDRADWIRTPTTG